MSILKGNYDNKGVTNITDAQYIINWVAAGGNETNIGQTLVDIFGNEYIVNQSDLLKDTGAGGIVNITDAQYIINWVAAGGNETNIGETLVDNFGNEYIINYIGSLETWNSFTKEISTSRYRYFIEIYNIPKNTTGLISGIKENDGIIVKNSNVDDSVNTNISSKSKSGTSGFINDYDNSQQNITNGNIGVSTNTFYHKSLSVPMKTSSITLKDVILYIFFPGNSYTNLDNNSGSQVPINFDDLQNNPIVYNNSTIIIDYASYKLIYNNNNQITEIDIREKIQNILL